ncbi:MAG TPA: pyridoxamine 5'-phosphate oxidase [Myxococcota bacterium]|nr:pyridoxamine 5'-phosphate oxidase [Myxococcota bacterium]
MSELSLSPSLPESELTPNPFTLFERWYAEALSFDRDANAMALATVDEDGSPEARMVLMRGIESGPAFEGREAIVFYTNYDSDKARALETNPRCAALFYWGKLEGHPQATAFGGRQVRISGRAERVEAALSDAYFAERPRLSQLGAWASPQSRPIRSREVLLAKVAEAVQRFGQAPVPRPPFWGGYRIVADRVEVWRSHEGRLHDRFVYRRADSSWTMTRLAP